LKINKTVIAASSWLPYLLYLKRHEIFYNELEVRNMSENTAIAKYSRWLHTMAGEVNHLRGGQVKTMFGTTVQLFNPQDQKSTIFLKTTVKNLWKSSVRNIFTHFEFEGVERSTPRPTPKPIPPRTIITSVFSYL
jgi:hypothetical protein